MSGLIIVCYGTDNLLIILAQLDLINPILTLLIFNHTNFLVILIKVSYNMSHSTYHKFATLTALATACSIMFAVPASAAPNDTLAVPSATDSSKRVVRRVQPSTTATPAQLTPEQLAANNAAVPSTRLYQPGPITATGIDISLGQLANIPVPQALISDVSFIKTILIDQDTRGNQQIDVSLLDDFIEDVSPNARHYPPNFPNRTQRYNAREKIKALSEWIDPYAKAPDASYDVLIRAAKLNGMGRNLDLGTDFAVRGSQYVDRAIKRKADSGEANFLYGMMLAEGGGFKEGQKYLDRAVALGYTEAEQSLAQSDLLSDRRSQALERLRRLERQNPNNPILKQQIKLVEDGKFYIWNIPAPDINVTSTM